MKKYNSFLLLVFSVMILFSCKNPEPVQYNVNKTPELQQYESELQAESLYAESLAQESLLAQEKAEEEKKAKEALIWKKKDIVIYMEDVNKAFYSSEYKKEYRILENKDIEEYIYIPNSSCFYKCIFRFTDKWYMVEFIVNTL